MRPRPRLSLFALAGVLALIGLTAVAWARRYALHTVVATHPSILPAIATALFVAWLTLTIGLWAEGRALHRAWLARAAWAAGLPRLAPVPWLSRVVSRLPDPLEWLARPILRTGSGRRLQADWGDAGWGTKPSRAVLLLVATGFTGGFVGARIGGPLLGAGLACALPILPRSWIRSRALAGRRRLSEQLPQALDALASGLAAGLSLPQAVEYASLELPQPSGGTLARLARRMAFGHPPEAALRYLMAEVPDEALSLAAEAILLQRQVGGDLVQVLEGTGAVLRDRVELEQEVRAVTAQGRLSGAVIAALVPVSAGILLTANPRYVDVLFNSWVGQGLLVMALILQLAGWAIMSRLVRIQY